MAESDVRGASSGGDSGSACPRWCITDHGAQQGEEDWLHVGEPLPVADGLHAQLCMSVDPATGRQEGPFVLIGATELTLAATATLGSALVQLTL
ncbi:hypothetical protein [Terrabacter sp. NPDC080008]|uniref:DUF6907 domain-containing protein n=1 Tax=Terrabacter sp. NPDC080008 TaxID=3155176 RepID=UPI00344F2F62